jgi:hypothetical protein
VCKRSVTVVGRKSLGRGTRRSEVESSRVAELLIESRKLRAECYVRSQGEVLESRELRETCCVRVSNEKL